MRIQVIFYKELPTQTKVRRIKRIPIRHLGLPKFIRVERHKIPVVINHNGIMKQHFIARNNIQG